MPTWNCPDCRRSFSRPGQRHACGTGDRGEVLRNRPAVVVAVYEAVEAIAQSLGRVEIVARERYVLFRTERIFADLVIMSDAVRLAVHLQREVADPKFIEIARDKKRVTHVAKLKDVREVERMRAYLTEAHEYSLAPENSATNE
ncbi:MAG TPA: DUF5655 domain-containing protein [Polyangiaceae bacterium]|jgi:predicted transport protein|nr:DUF5655 domain-containing protein [Polyangiaceae bacterium]